MHILIIGAGAAGGLLGARIALAGHSVTLVGRARFVDAVRASGLTLIEPDASSRVAQVIATETLASAFGLEIPFDLAFLTVKAYDTTEIVAQLRAAAPLPPPIVTLQNGVGNEEVLADAFGSERVIAGAIDTPVSVPAPAQVQIHRARFRAGLAPVGNPSRLAMPSDLLSKAGFEVTAYSDYRSLKWSKLLLNLPANALCAIADMSPAEVMSHSVGARLEAMAWQEALRVMQRLGVRPVALAGYPLPLVAPLARILPPGWLARGLARIVAGGRGTKRPSLQMALLGGQRTEAPWLNGAVAQRAHDMGIRAPVNAAFTRVLVALSEGRESMDDWRGRPERFLPINGS